MLYRVFTVPISDPAAVDEMNRFLAGRRVLSVHREFVQNGGQSCWAFCVEFLPSARPDGHLEARKERVDYKEILPPAQFAVFARLRECRKRLATQEGLPAFAVFTDEQLAALARIETLTKAAMQQVEGIGEAKAGKYGEAFVAAHGNAGTT